METVLTKTYYNAKPSQITNFGEDLTGAKRHNFDTYENVEEKKERKERNKSRKDLKSLIKEEVLKESPNFEILYNLLEQDFKQEHGFSEELGLNEIKEILLTARKSNTYNRQEFNKKASGYNKILRLKRALTNQYYQVRELEKMRNRYKPKDSFQEKNGMTFDWKLFKTEKLTDIKDLDDKTRAIQFGNSVSDNERVYIISEMIDFLEHWNTAFPHYNLYNVGWSFGARGNNKSVAFFEPLKNIISVNRNNIGSIIHEVGHFLDFNSDRLSNSISRDCILNYRDKLLKNNFTGKHLSYLLKPTEIFARAFEAYCFQNFKFKDFSLVVDQNVLPDLNHELISLIEQIKKEVIS
jgi:hypothetical protein